MPPTKQLAGRLHFRLLTKVLFRRKNSKNILPYLKWPVYKPAVWKNVAPAMPQKVPGFITLLFNLQALLNRGLDFLHHETFSFFSSSTILLCFNTSTGVVPLYRTGFQHAGEIHIAQEQQLFS